MILLNVAIIIDWVKNRILLIIYLTQLSQFLLGKIDCSNKPKKITNAGPIKLYHK